MFGVAGWDFARWFLRATSHLEWARIAVELARPVKQLVVIHDLARCREDFACRAGVDVALLVECEVFAREGAVLTLRLVDDRNMRRDLLVVDEPIERRRGPVGRIGS